jgi:hypothetical protein
MLGDRRAARRGPPVTAASARPLRVLAVARYLVALLFGAQRYLQPALLALAVLGVLFGGDPGPPPTPWAASALAMYPLAAWFALIVANAEDPVQRTVTVASAGGRGTVAAATLLVALAGDVVLVVLSVFGPVLLTRYAYPPEVMVLGLLAHIACTSAGTAVGLLCARPVVRRIGWSFGLVWRWSWCPPSSRGCHRSVPRSRRSARPVTRRWSAP